ncbi:MAG: AAA family ATPase [Bacteroidetes bacterium]|nr:AAA family ATPase [Bacteroidota bacterium]MBU2584681.1 AAA family ATPase [Bacteroidota bacterium]
MFFRTKINDLLQWAEKPNRKPLIIRGARQVGKTTLVNMFAERFEQYIYLNLERPEDRKLFNDTGSSDKIIQSIFLAKSKSITVKKTLIFIDEIQNSSTAMKMLRYFYEDFPEIYVIAAGSLLESLLDFKESFPVGRVEYEYLYPFSFEEYLLAKGKNGLVEALQQVPFTESLAHLLKEEYSNYALIGGMPEIIKTYVQTNDLNNLKSIYESLLVSYLDDVEKYARNQNWSNILKHIIKTSFNEAGSRIKYEGFGKSHYKNREVKEAFSLLEKTMLLKLMFPTNSTRPPITMNFGRAPKLHVLDTGLINYFAGIQKEFVFKNNLEDVYSGRIAEHLVGQEFFALKNSQLNKPTFWLREKSQSSAEVDFVYRFEDILIPVEVKSGKSGRLRSLMQFMDAAPHNVAVRIYSGDLTIEETQTINGKKFLLLNLPIFLTGKLESYLEWMRNFRNLEMTYLKSQF